MAVYTVRLQNVSGPDVVSLTDGTTYATLAVNPSVGPRGAGWTGVSYATGTGRFTFTSNDGLGYISDDIRVGLDADLLDGQHGSYYTSYTDTAIANLIDTAPATLDTLNELAAALGDDPNFATTVTNNIATKVSKAGDTMTGNLSFGDNNKAIFGAGSDLQIYHTGSNSYIKDAGTGQLILQGAAQVIIQSSATGDDMIKANSGADVRLYHNNSAKLATTSTGVDVTGTVTADGLTVDGAASVTGDLTVDTNTLVVDSTNNRVGIGTISPTAPLDVVGDITARSGTVLADQYANYSGNMTLNSTGSLPIVFQTNSTERMRIDSSGNVLVGTTTSPSGSGQIVANGGVYFGGTGAANLLDDYEEGTFVPYWNAGTPLVYITQQGNYTKVGNVVTYHVYLAILSGSIAGNVIGGLPFTSSNTGNLYQMTGGVWNDATISYPSGRTSLGAYTNPNTTLLTVECWGSGIAPAYPIFSSTSSIYITGYYYTDA